MTINELISMGEARLTFLEANMRAAEQIGDVVQVTGLLNQIEETKRTVASLKVIQG